MVSVHYAYDYMEHATLEAHKGEYFSSTPLGIAHYSNCYGLPYKNLSKCGRNIVGGGLRIDEDHTIGTLYEPEWDSEEVVSSDVVYIGHFSSICWGHTITDSLARLWWVVDHLDTILSKCVDVYFISETPLDGNFKDIVRLLGIPVERLRRIDCVSRFRSVFVPDSCFNNHQVSLKYTREYVSLVEHLIQKKSNGTYSKKIFLIREDSNRQLCSAEIRNILENQGFTSVYPEKLSVPSQIAIFNNADSIVCEESSLSHNFIFCRKGAKVAILRKANIVNVYQALINQMKELEVDYIDCHLSICLEKAKRGPFFLYANNNLCRYFHEEPKSFPYEEFASYVNLSGVGDVWKKDINIDPNYRGILMDIIK